MESFWFFCIFCALLGGIGIGISIAGAIEHPVVAVMQP